MVLFQVQLKLTLGIWKPATIAWLYPENALKALTELESGEGFDPEVNSSKKYICDSRKQCSARTD